MEITPRMIPERIMGTAQMNASNITDGAYIGSAMYKTNLAQFKTVIKNDFETSHILKHRNHLQNAVSNGCETGGTWYDSDIELMNEIMVYGCQIFKNATNGSTFPNNYQIDNSQLSLFRLRHDLIVARNDAGDRYWYWLRDVVSSANFACRRRWCFEFQPCFECQRCSSCFPNRVIRHRQGFMPCHIV